MRNEIKLNTLKIGDKIKHYQCGELVEATIIDIKQNYVKTEHNPVRWGNDIFTNCIIQKSTPLQEKTNSITPAAFTMNGDKIIL